MQHLDLHIPKELRSGDRISCRINEEIIEGEVSLSPKDIIVRLTDPEFCLEAFIHTMLMQPMLYTIDSRTLVANDRGISRVQAMIIGLAQDYLLLKENKEEIFCRLPQYLPKVQEHDKAILALEQEKREITRGHKLGHTPQSEYSCAIKSIEDRKTALSEALKQEFKKIFSDILSECTHCDNLMQVIRSLQA